MQTITFKQLYLLKEHDRRPYLQIKGSQFCTFLNQQGSDFFDHRPYQLGDAPNLIDWMTTARTGSLWIKKNQEELKRATVFLLDLRSSMFFSTSSYCKAVISLQAFSLLGWHAVERKHEVGCIVLTETGIQSFLPRTGENYFCSLLKSVLSTYEKNYVSLPTESTNKSAMFGEALFNLKKHTDNQTDIFIISDFISLDSCSQVHLNTFLPHQSVSALRITDPVEKGEIPQGIFPISDGHHTLFVPVKDKKSHHRFVATCKNQFKRIKKQLLTYGLSLYDLTTKESVVDQVTVLRKEV